MQGNNIKEFRIKFNLTQQELAKLTGLCNTYLSHLENGVRTNPSYSVMKKIANAFHCEISDIFGN